MTRMCGAAGRAARGKELTAARHPSTTGLRPAVPLPIPAAPKRGGTGQFLSVCAQREWGGGRRRRRLTEGLADTLVRGVDTCDTLAAGNARFRRLFRAERRLSRGPAAARGAAALKGLAMPAMAQGWHGDGAVGKRFRLF